MNKLFTLIELIVVIAVLGILAAIIIPNISSFQEEANTTAIKSNVRNLQTGVDMYSLDNYSSVPTMGGQPTEYEPKPVDFDEMHPNYTRDLPETPGVKYWVDGWGKVWASTIDSPENVDLIGTTLTWDTVPEADMYKVYKVLNLNNSSSIFNADKKLVFYKEASKDEYSNFPVEDGNVQYAVSAIDHNKFESAPAGNKYKGFNVYTGEVVTAVNLMNNNGYKYMTTSVPLMLGNSESNFTIFARIKGQGMVISNPRNGSYDYGLGRLIVESNGTLSYQLFYDGASPYFKIVRSSIKIDNLNEFNDIALIADSKQDRYTFYINGQTETLIYNMPYFSNSLNNTQIEIGRFDNVWDNGSAIWPYQGYISNVRLWNDKIEVSDLYNQNNNSLVADWDPNNIEGNKIKNNVNNNYDLEVKNTIVEKVKN